MIKATDFTYWDEELLDFIHGVSHSQVVFRYGCCNLNEHMKLHGEVSIFGLSSLSKLFFLEKIAKWFKIIKIIKKEL